MAPRHESCRHQGMKNGWAVGGGVCVGVWRQNQGRHVGFGGGGGGEAGSGHQHCRRECAGSGVCRVRSVQGQECAGAGVCRGRSVQGQECVVAGVCRGRSVQGPVSQPSPYLKHAGASYGQGNV